MHAYSKDFDQHTGSIHLPEYCYFRDILLTVILKQIWNNNTVCQVILVLFFSSGLQSTLYRRYGKVLCECGICLNNTEQYNKGAVKYVFVNIFFSFLLKLDWEFLWSYRPLPNEKFE